MQKDEAQQILLKIIEYAQKGELTKFHLITSWSNFKVCWQNIKATKLVIRALKATANNLFKDYLKEITLGTQNIERLLAYVSVQNTIAFYEQDLAILQRMFDEYDEYLGKGHFWYSFLGGERDIWN